MAKTKATVAVNAFVGKPKPPTEKELEAALATCRPLWDLLLDCLAHELELTDREWNTYSPKAGWSLRMKHRDRIIVYLAPLQGSFLASFALGDKAVRVALAGGLPQATVDLIKNGRKYAEGTAVRIEVKTVADVAIVKKLAEAKLRN